eukprot:10300642-Heterocapsa_arctica.AAC.1
MAETTRGHVDLVGLARRAERAVYGLYLDILVGRHARAVHVHERPRGAGDQHAGTGCGRAEGALH